MAKPRQFGAKPLSVMLSDVFSDVYAKQGRTEQAAAEWERSLAEWHRSLPADMETDKIAEVWPAAPCEAATAVWTWSHKNWLRTQNGSADSSAQAAPLRILIADDNRDAADSLSMLLKLSGHDIKVARTGGEALTVASQFRPEML